jgi:hypothetical protein
MLGRGVPLKLPRGEEPLVAAVDWAAPILPGLAEVMEAEEGVRPDLADLQTRDADQQREEALDLAEWPGEGLAEGTVRPHSAPLTLELVFDKHSRHRASTGSWVGQVLVAETTVVTIP